MSFIGKLLYRCFYKPIGEHLTIKKYGGYKAYNKMLESEAEMKDFALNSLQINLQFNPDGKFKLNFLTGEKFLHQTLFCLASFSKFLSEEEAKNFSITFYDDGTLTNDFLLLIKNKISNVRIISYQDSIQNLRDKLPLETYPYIHKKVKDLFFFNKIFFIHSYDEPGLKIYLDSDMLFINRPSELLSWLNENYLDPTASFTLEDVERSYGYSDEIISLLAKEIVTHKYNAGFYGIHSSKIDFDEIEQLIKTIETNYGPSYYMEQFITALILNRQKNLYILPNTEYIVFPNKEESELQIGKLHHYVNISKKEYFNLSWRFQI